MLSFICCSEFVGDSLSLPIKYLQPSIKCKPTHLRNSRIEGQVCMAESTSTDSKISTDGFDAGNSGSFRGGTFISLRWKFDFPALCLQDMITPNTVESFKGRQHMLLDGSLDSTSEGLGSSLGSAPYYKGFFLSGP